MKKLGLILALVATGALLTWTLLRKPRAAPGDDLVILEPVAGPAKNAAKPPLNAAAIRLEIAAAVKAGKLTQAQAAAKLEWLTNRVAPAKAVR